MLRDAVIGRANSGGDGSDATSGFALILVLWVIGLIALLVFTLAWTARLQIQSAAVLVENAKAEALANAGVEFVRAGLLSAQEMPERAGRTGDTVFCRIADGALAAVALENEAGKVNLNAASAETLVRMIEGLGTDASGAWDLAEAIHAFASVAIGQQAQDGMNRDDQTAKAPPPKHGPFETVLELDQVQGMTRELFQSLLPYVTVHSNRSDVDTDLASPELLAILSGERERRDDRIGSRSHIVRGTIRSSIEQASAYLGSNLMVHVEVLTPANGYFVREANLAIVAGSNPIRTVEWRRGRPRYHVLLTSALREGASNQASVGVYPDCWSGSS